MMPSPSERTSQVKALLIKCVFLWSDMRQILFKLMPGYLFHIYTVMSNTLVKITQSTHFPGSFSQEGIRAYITGGGQHIIVFLPLL